MDTYVIAGIVGLWLLFLSALTYRWGRVDGFQDGYEQAMDDHADAVRYFLGED